MSAKASIGALGEVRNLAVISLTDSLRFTWTAPEEVDAFLSHHHIYFNGATTPIVLPASATSYDATGLLPATGYPFRITTVDTFGTESAGLSLLAATLLDHPNNLLAGSFDGMVRLTWSHAEPNDLVKHYAVYSSLERFHQCGGINAGSDYARAPRRHRRPCERIPRFFAVTTVNIVGERSLRCRPCQPLQILSQGILPISL